jgi:hypothetical protein
MDPLDLSVTAPRPTRDKIAGVMFLPRTVDKLRAELPGGNLNSYLTDYDRGLTSYVLYKLGIELGDLRGVVAAAIDEDVTWLTDRIDPARGPAINAKLEAMRIDAMRSDDRALFYERHPNVTPGAHESVLDAIDAEDLKVGAG